MATVTKNVLGQLCFLNICFTETSINHQKVSAFMHKQALEYKPTVQL